MRWFWIDRIVELVPNTRLVAIKNVSLAEDYLHDHFPADHGVDAMPVFPAPLIIEGMAQTAGILVGSARQFEEKVILAKVVRAGFDCEVFPGHTIRYEAEIQRIDDAGAATTGTVERGCPVKGDWQLVGRIDLLFSHIDKNTSGLELPEHNFVFGNNFNVLLKEIREAVQG